MIRDATKEDVGALVTMMTPFGLELEQLAHSVFDADSLADSLLGWIENANIALIVADGEDAQITGAIAGIITAAYFNANHIIAQELGWWVDDAFRGSGVGGELLSAFELWAKSNGASTVIMTAIVSPMVDVVGKMYEKRGYSRLEVNYSKGVT